MRAVLLVVAGLALIGFLAVSIVLPNMAGSEAREAAAALIVGAEAAKQQVSAAAQKSGNLAGSGAGVKVAPRNDAKHGELKWIVEQNGAIRGWNEKNAIEIALQPRLEGGKLSWSCRGYPNTSMPPDCGGRS
jgi:type II secretory pathway pseudopilin PulG